MVGRARVVVCLVATIIAGCTVGEPGRNSSAGQTPSLPTQRLPEGWNRCVNEVEGWSVGYPETWFTTDVYTDALTGRDVPRPRSACTRFDPRPFTVPLDGDPSYMALEAGIARSPIEAQIASLTNRAFYRTLLQERWIVLGRPAIRLEVESLGDV